MGYDYGVQTGLSFAFGTLALVYIISLAIGIFSIVCTWKIYKKAGKEGWESIIPIYNVVVLLQITNVSMWYLLLLFVPIANIVVIFLVYIELAKRFGKTSAFGVGLVFLSPIFMAILAFSNECVYQMPMMGYNNQQMYGQPMNNQGYNNYAQQMNTQQNNNYGQPMNNQGYNNQQSVQQNPKFCQNCGSPLHEGDKFCMNCGTQL